MQASQLTLAEAGTFLVLGSFGGLMGPHFSLKGYQRADIWGRRELNIDVRVGLASSGQGNLWCWPGWEEQGKGTGQRCLTRKSATHLQGLCGLFYLYLAIQVVMKCNGKVGRYILLKNSTTCSTAINYLNICYVDFQLLSYTGPQCLGTGLLFQKPRFSVFVG